MIVMIPALPLFDLVLLLGVPLLGVALLVWGALHCIREGESPGWLIAMIALPVIGPAWYFVRYTLSVRQLGPGSGITLPRIGRRERRRRIKQIEARRSQGIRIPDETRRLAEAMFADGRADRSIELAREYLEGSPRDLHMRYLVAVTHHQAKRWRDAIVGYQDIVSVEPNFDGGMALVGLGRSFEATGDVDRARMCFETALDYGRNIEARYELARLARDAGNHDSARTLLREVIEDARLAPPFKRRVARYWARQARRMLTSLEG